MELVEEERCLLLFQTENGGSGNEGDGEDNGEENSENTAHFFFFSWGKYLIV